MMQLFNPEANFGENKPLESPMGSLVWGLQPYLHFRPCSEAATEVQPLLLVFDRATLQVCLCPALHLADEDLLNSDLTHY